MEEERRGESERGGEGEGERWKEEGESKRGGESKKERRGEESERGGDRINTNTPTKQ